MTQTPSTPPQPADPAADSGKPDRRGTFWDWPVGLMAFAVIMFCIVTFSGGTPTLLVWAIFVVGLIIWLARRGTFSARK